jgi:uncharacterized protein YkwD
LRLTYRAFVCAVAAAMAASLILLAATPASVDAACKDRTAVPGSISVKRAERTVFCLLKKHRRKAGVPKLRRHTDLDRPSRKHSRFMIENRCFDHACPGEPELVERLRNYLSKGGRAWGENIAWGGGELGSPRSIVRSWMRSPGHARNILSTEYRHVGIGVVWGSPEIGRVPAATYTTAFGARSG